MTATILVAVLVLAISRDAIQSVSRPMAPSTLPSAAREFLGAHNQARAAVGVEPLKWSAQLADATDLLARCQRNKMSCQFANLKEKSYYDYATNSCAQNHRCGVYKQGVLKNSTELGCAQATRKNQISLTICFCNPPGNYVGEGPN
ncbi:STS14 protein-like [Hibiscus syriacus]|uniref:STS14 protein-like n=1 Tax=Hibiscus syriacus TaxID=106335 RepID=UPI001921095A|nr:STS14 protein-like [Hibiscus syriacus]